MSVADDMMNEATRRHIDSPHVDIVSRGRTS